MFVMYLIFLCSVLTLSYSASVDSSSKCGINDGPCQIKLIHYFLRDLSKDGGADGGVTGVDPYPIRDLSLSVPDLINTTFIDGSLSGIRDCIVTSYNPNIEKGRAVIEVACEHIAMKGHYKFSSTSPIVQALLGADSIHGDGNAKVKLDKLLLKINIFYKAVERGGEVYIAINNKKTRLANIDIGKITFDMDNFYVGEEESSKKIVEFLNENWKLLISTFGKSFGGKFIGIGIEKVSQLFNTIPAKNYIIEDMKQYVH